MGSRRHFDDLASDSGPFLFDGFDLIFVIIDEDIFKESSLIFVFKSLFVLSESDFFFSFLLSSFISVD